MCFKLFDRIKANHPHRGLNRLVGVFIFRPANEKILLINELLAIGAPGGAYIAHSINRGRCRSRQPLKSGLKYLGCHA